MTLGASENSLERHAFRAFLRCEFEIGYLPSPQNPRLAINSNECESD
jgi:hypothetical protein